MYTEAADIDGSNVMGLIYVSKKYLIPELTNLCFKFLEGGLSCENVCIILMQSIMFDEMGLVGRGKLLHGILPKIHIHKETIILLIFFWILDVILGLGGTID